ncbi:energy transducer TonB [Saccharicrinis sp. FJH62]|uniref:energy transducer TonB n=1 Tax=Saccharicrinis sp. FJH62 TaxID=3344657 RepID=UPI0035D470DC
MIRQYKTKIIRYKLFLVSGLMLLALSAYGQKVKKVKQKLPDNLAREFYVLKSDPDIKEGYYREENKRTGKLTEGNYHNNKKSKLWSYYSKDAGDKKAKYHLNKRGTYSNERKDGIWQYYNYRSLVERLEYYSSGILDSAFIFDDLGIKVQRAVFYYNGHDSVIFQYNVNEKPVYAYDSKSDQILRYHFYNNPPEYMAKIDGNWIKTGLDYPALLINFEELMAFYKNRMKENSEGIVGIPIIQGTVDKTGKTTDLVFLDNLKDLNENDFITQKSFNDSIMSYLYSKDLKWIPAHKNGEAISSRFYFNPTGFKNYIHDNPICYEKEDAIIYIKPEDMPSFPGGEMAMMSYLSNIIRYPAEAQKKGIQGRVYVNFVIKKDGTIKNIKVIRGVHQSLNEEAVRVVKNMPKWIPGKVNGIPVNVSFMLPINFVLN